jgi:hypothetical protein
MYARYALALMVGSGYQARAGICTAGHYGCAQVRVRTPPCALCAGIHVLSSSDGGQRLPGSRRHLHSRPT